MTAFQVRLIYWANGSDAPYRAFGEAGGQEEVTTISKTIEAMTDREVLDALVADTPLSRVRRVFSAQCAEIEQANLQRDKPAPGEILRMELQAANCICGLFGIALP